MTSGYSNIMIGNGVGNWSVGMTTGFSNVFIGDMSLVGPRPQIKKEVKLYTKKEMELLNGRSCQC